MAQRVVFLVFPGFQLLDATGPIAAFEIAARLVPDAYRQRIAAIDAGRVVSSVGIALDASAVGPLARMDTLIVVGGDGTRSAYRDRRLIALLVRAAKRVPRVASVCSGALLLAEAGVLDGRRATTHWSRAGQMARRYPEVEVAADSIWVRDGKFWTSAGITAGIDLALAMISDDLGSEVARNVARQLVVYAQRPGGQTQHSQLLELAAPSGPFAALHTWMRANLRGDLRIEVLASKANMSMRTFARSYVAAIGVTPAKTVERLRVEAARALIESGVASMQEVATGTGFGDVERMRRAFLRLFGTPPSSLRRTRKNQADAAMARRTRPTSDTG